MLPNERAQAAEAVRESFFKNVTLLPGQIVAGYWPIRGELDVLPILRELLARGHACALPKVTGEGSPLLFRQWNEAAPMAVGKYGITEPAAGEAVIPDIILLP